MKRLLIFLSFVTSLAFTTSSSQEVSILNEDGAKVPSGLVRRSDQTSRAQRDQGHVLVPQRQNEPSRRPNQVQPLNTQGRQRTQLQLGEIPGPGGPRPNFQPMTSRIQRLQALTADMGPGRRQQQALPQGMRVSPFAGHPPRPPTPSTPSTPGSSHQPFQPMRSSLQMTRQGAILPGSHATSRSGSLISSTPWTMPDSRQSSGPPTTYAQAFQRLGITPPESPRQPGPRSATRQMQDFARMLGASSPKPPSISTISSLSTLPSGPGSQRPRNGNQQLPISHDPTQSQQWDTDSIVPSRPASSAGRVSSQFGVSSRASSGAATVRAQNGQSERTSIDRQDDARPAAWSLPRMNPVPRRMSLGHQPDSTTSVLQSRSLSQNEEHDMLLDRSLVSRSLSKRGVVRPQTQNQGKAKAKDGTPPKSSESSTKVQAVKETTDSPKAAGNSPSASSRSSSASPPKHRLVSNASLPGNGSPRSSDATSPKAQDSPRGRNGKEPAGPSLQTALGGRLSGHESQDELRALPQSMTSLRINSPLSRSSSLGSFKTALSRSSSSDSFHSAHSGAAKSAIPPAPRGKGKKGGKRKSKQSRPQNNAMPRHSSSPNLTTPPSARRQQTARRQPPPEHKDRLGRSDPWLSSPNRIIPGLSDDSPRSPFSSEAGPSQPSRKPKKQQQKAGDPSTPPRQTSTATQTSPQAPVQQQQQPGSPSTPPRRTTSTATSYTTAPGSPSTPPPPPSLFANQPPSPAAIGSPWSSRRAVQPIGSMRSPERPFLTSPIGSSSSVTTGGGGLLAGGRLSGGGGSGSSQFGRLGSGHLSGGSGQFGGTGSPAATNTQEEPGGWDPMFGKSVDAMMSYAKAAKRG